KPRGSWRTSKDSARIPRRGAPISWCLDEQHREYRYIDPESDSGRVAFTFYSCWYAAPHQRSWWRQAGGFALSGWTVPGYTETGVLGSGATGRVVAAVRGATGAEVAIKYL